MSAPRLGAGGVIGGKYTVSRLLGDGGAVITYACVNREGQEVAVKLYDPAVAGHAAVMKALEQAYATTNALPANSVAPIVDAGYDQPTLAPFSVTELLRLPSLAAQQRRLAPEEVIGLLRGLARSLDLAHVRQVVHGALKPTNIFIGPNFNAVIVTDFAANLPKAAVPTQAGYVGSAPWIAPEQAQSGNVGPGADVFAMGLVLFYALTGRSYWKSLQTQTLDLAGWQQELVAPRAPASARAAEIGVPLSPSLDAALWKALALDPNERFKSIGELTNVLEETLQRQARGNVGAQGTVALPAVGDGPAPRAPQPQSAPPGPGGGGAATMALPLSAIVPPQSPHAATQMLGPGALDPYAQEMQQQQAMAAAANYRPDFPAAPPPPPSMNQANAQYAYNYASPMEGAYPPPPAVQQPYAPQLPRSGSKKVVPIIIALTSAAVVAGLGAVWFVKLRNAPTIDDDAPVKVAATTTTPSTTATATSSAAPPPTTDTAAPVPAGVDVKLTCVPDCEKITIDGKERDLKEPLKLAAGEYAVEVSRAGYVSQKTTIIVDAVKPFDKRFDLVKEPKKVTGVSTGTTTKQPTCKKEGFVNRCKN